VLAGRVRARRPADWPGRGCQAGEGRGRAGGSCDVRWRAARRPADPPALRGGHRAGVRGPFQGVGAFHLPEQRQQDDGELRHRILRIRGVDPDRVGEVAHPDPARGQVVDQVQRVAHGAPEPVEGVHHDHVLGAGVTEQRPQARPVGGRAGLLVHEDPLGRDPELGERVRLPVEVLFRGRHPRVPEIHDRTVSLVGSVAALRHAVVNLTCETPRAALVPAGRPARGGVSLPRNWDAEPVPYELPVRDSLQRAGLAGRSARAPPLTCAVPVAGSLMDGSRSVSAPPAV
jgi:hypothetical protein